MTPKRPSAPGAADQRPAAVDETESPLAGLRVLELATYVTGPYAGALLADMGADVIKLEERTRGDPFRGWGKGGYSPTFRSVNRGKRSIAIDLRTEAGRSVAEGIARKADVVIQNFRPGVAERLGMGYEQVAAINPAVVYCSISGFGSSGPYRDRPGYDTVGQAMSGLLGLLTDLEAPRAMGISLSDHITGLYACYGVLAALVGRGLRGTGRHVQTSLLQATTAFVAENAARFLDDGEVPSRATRAHIAQAYAFTAGDQRPFVIHLSSPPKFWLGLVEAIGRPELRTDERFVDRPARIRNYDALHEILQAAFATAPRDHWLSRLESADVPAGPLNSIAEALSDPGIEALGLVQHVVHPTAGAMRLLGSGVTLDRHLDVVGPPPLLGEHTEPILAELGYSDDTIARLRKDEVI